MRLVYCSRVPLEGRRRGETERGLAAMEFGDALESVAKGKVACGRDAAETFSSCSGVLVAEKRAVSRRVVVVENVSLGLELKWMALLAVGGGQEVEESSPTK